MPVLRYCPSNDALGSYLHDALAPADVEAIEEHLSSCPDCPGRLREALGQDPLLKLGGSTQPAGAAGETPPPGLRSRLLALVPPGPDDNDPDCEDPSVALHPPEGPGELGRLGGYRVLRLLGRGGMGVVWLAEDAHLRRPVALKVIRPGWSADPRAAALFLREARALAALSHEHVVNVYQAGRDGPTLFLAMEYLEGETLADWMGRTPRRPLGEALRAAREAADGLAYAHGRGVLHRDIKPANLWRCADRGRLKLIDFGLARQPGDEAVTRPGDRHGTPAYMAPEVVAGSPADARADLFALGAVLYELVAGASPFARPCAAGTVAAVAGYEPPPLDSVHPWLPVGLSALTGRLLSKDPARRPESAAEVARLLREVEEETVRWGTAGRPVGAPEGEPAAPRPRSRLWATLVALILTVSAAAVAGQYVEVRTRKGEVVRKIPLEPGEEVRVVPGVPAPNPGEGPKGLPADKSGAPAKSDGPAPTTAPAVKPGEPLGPFAVTKRPQPLPGVSGWTTEAVRHRGHPIDVAYQPGGSLLAVRSSDGMTRLYDVTTGSLARVLVPHAGSDWQHRVWDGSDGLQWAADGRRLLAGATHVWESAGGRLLAVLDGSRGCLSPDGERALVWSQATGKLVLTDARTGRPAAEVGALEGLLTAAAWHPTRSLVAVGGTHVRPQLRDLGTGKAARLLEPQFGGLVQTLAWSPDGKRLAGFDGTRLRVWVGEAGHDLWKGVVDPNSFGGRASLAWGPDGTTLAFGTDYAEPAKGAALYLFDASRPGAEPAVVDVRAAAVAWSPDGRHLAVANRHGDRAVRVIDRAGKVARTIEPDGGTRFDAAGHYRAPRGGRADVVHVVETGAGQETLLPAEFERRYGWKNDPSAVVTLDD